MEAFCTFTVLPLSRLTSVYRAIGVHRRSFGGGRRIHGDGHADPPGRRPVEGPVKPQVFLGSPISPWQVR